MYQKLIQTILEESRKVNRVRLTNNQIDNVILTVQKLQNVSLQKVVDTITSKCTTCSGQKKIIPIVKQDNRNNRLPTKFVDFDTNIQWL